MGRFQSHLLWVLIISNGILLYTVLQDPLHAQSRIDDIKGPKGSISRSDDIPAGNSGWAFNVGSGAETDNLTPPSYSDTLKIDASYSAGFGYSCGKFDPFENVQAMLKAAIEKFKKLPQMFVTAAQQAIAALPAYILNKINPSLYNVVTKNLDDAFKLFEVNFKDCQQIEREIALGMNPYHSLVMAGIGDRMRVEMGFGTGTIDERMDNVQRAGPSNGVVMAGGKRYGGIDQDPIDVVTNVVSAGFNLLTNRSHDDNSELLSGIEAKKHPIANVFKKPSDMVQFVTDIYGSKAYMLTESSGPTASKPGKGYLPKYIELRDDTIEALQNYVYKKIDRRTFEQQTGMLIPPATIDEIRRLTSYARSVAIDDQARMHAVKELQLRFDYIQQALKTGLTEPNLAQSEAYEVVERDVDRLLMNVRDDVAHINTAVFLQ